MISHTQSDNESQSGRQPLLQSSRRSSEDSARGVGAVGLSGTKSQSTLVNITSHAPSSSRLPMKNQPAAGASCRAVNKNMKYIALFALVIQNASLVLCMRYAKTREGAPFKSSTAVCMTELLKLCTCFIVVFFECGMSISNWLAHLHSFLVANFLDTLKVAVPAFMYVIQNNLLYLSLENLPVATYQVTYQTKILTTAIFSITMLGRDISRRQWFALIVLFIGVGIVQLDDSKEKGANQDLSNQNNTLGFIAVLLACCSSGFAGVYFEKILKGSPVSIWTRNIQLGLFGFVIGLITALFKDGKDISANGWFYGYDIFTYLVIGNAACGGLLVAVVMKYADNILKGFACSVSIIVSAVFSIFLFNFEVTGMFCGGTSLVISAVYLYSLPGGNK